MKEAFFNASMSYLSQNTMEFKTPVCMAFCFAQHQPKDQHFLCLGALVLRAHSHSEDCCCEMLRLNVNKDRDRPVVHCKGEADLILTFLKLIYISVNEGCVHKRPGRRFHGREEARKWLFCQISTQVTTSGCPAESTEMTKLYVLSSVLLHMLSNPGDSWFLSLFWDLGIQWPTFWQNAGEGTVLISYRLGWVPWAEVFWTQDCTFLLHSLRYIESSWRF